MAVIENNAGVLAPAKASTAAALGSPAGRRRPGARPGGADSSRLSGFVDRHVGLIFLFPAAAVLAALMLYPLCYMLYMSTFEWFVGGRVPPRFVALGNYAALLQDPRFGYALLRTLFYTAIALGVEVTIGTGMALLLSRSFLGRGLTRTLLLLPMVATPVAISLVWLLMFDPVLGVLNYLLGLLGLPGSAWASSPGTALLSLALVDVWQWTPLVMLIVLAGLAALPPDPYEAAVLDGASAIQRFIYITLPLLRPYLIVAALFRGIDAMKAFDTIYVITKGGPGRSSETLSLYIYANAFDYLHVGYSSAMVVVYSGIVLCLSMVLIRYRRGFATS